VRAQGDGLVVTLGLRAQGSTRNGDGDDVAVDVQVGGQGHVATRVVDVAARDATRNGPLVVPVGQVVAGVHARVVQRTRIAGVVDGVVDAAVGALDAQGPAVQEVVGRIQALLVAQDQLVLGVGLQAAGGHGFRIRHAAVLAVVHQVVRTVGVAAGGVHRHLGHGIQATGVGVVEVGVVRGRSGAQGDVGGDRQGVTADRAEHLGITVAQDIPGEADARLPDVVLLHEGDAVRVLVLERVVTQTRVQHEVVGDVPVVLDVPGLLVDLHAA